MPPAPTTPADARSGISGRVLLDGKPAPGACVFVYPPTQPSPSGPGFVGMGVADGEGRFGVGLDPGTYKVGVRRRAGGDGPGFPRVGDHRADVQPETIEVTAGNWLGLGDLALRPIDPEKVAKPVSRVRQPTSTALAGRVVGTGGAPRPGYMVFAYRNPDMMGRPDAVAKARADGTYTLYLPAGGAYSLRARLVGGGAVQPGEPIGVVSGSATSRLEIPAGETLRGVDLVVEGEP